VAARDGKSLYFNATAVALEARAALFLGPSGCGKSATALALMAYGAQLISDDGVWLRDGLLMTPETAPDLIEARGIGLLNSGPRCASAPMKLVVVLGQTEEERLPPLQHLNTSDENVPLIRTASTPTLVPALLQILRHGRDEI
jgi:HPr kinase/phosphorylase